MNLTRSHVVARLSGLCAAMLLINPSWSAATTLSLKPGQVQALGVQAQSISGQAQSVSRYPALIVLPSGQERVVAAPLAGLIESIQVSVGDAVRAGQVVAVLRSTQVQELVRDVLTADSQAALALSASSRDELLYKEGLIPLSRLEASRAQARQAQWFGQQQRQALQSAGGSVSNASGTIKLLAPISGVVLERTAAVGQRVDQATGLLRVASLSPLWAEVHVPAGEAAAIRPGDSLSLVGSKVQGRVITVGHQVDAANQSVLVRAEIRPVPAGLRIGQAVEAQLVRADATATQVPASAVLDDGGKPMVFVETGAGKYQTVAVQVISSAGGITAIKGLEPNSRVVVQGTSALKALLAAARP